jgi:hypothetical protein
MLFMALTRLINVTEESRVPQALRGSASFDLAIAHHYSVLKTSNNVQTLLLLCTKQYKGFGHPAIASFSPGTGFCCI